MEDSQLMCEAGRPGGADLAGVCLSRREGPAYHHARALSLSTEWYGILGLIGWAYLVTCVVFLVFRGHRTAILGCMALLMCLFVADKKGVFDGFWLNSIVGIGGTLGSLASIAVGGFLLGSMLAADDMSSLKARTRFTFWFVAGCAAAALLLNRTYGISKNNATPSWCFWSCAITAALWYVFYLISDVRPVKPIRDRWRWRDKTCSSPT